MSSSAIKTHKLASLTSSSVFKIWKKRSYLTAGYISHS